MKTTLIYAITLLLKLPDSSRQRLSHIKRRPLSPKVMLVIKTNLLEFKPAPIKEINQHPFLRVTDSSLDSDSPDNKHSKGKMILTIAGKQPSNFSKIEASVWSHDGSENIVKKFEIKIS